MNHEPRSDREDEDGVVDAMLAELLGSAKAPDLTTRIATELDLRPTAVTLTKVAAPEFGPPAKDSAGLPSTQATVTRAGGVSWRLLAAAAAAGILVGFAFSELARAPMRVPVRVEVVQGSAELRATRLHGATHLALGDHIHSTNGAVLRLRPFGTLDLGRNSTVEVKAMEWTKRDGGLVVGSLAFGSVLGAFAWSQFGDTPAEASGPIGNAEVGTEQPTADPATHGFDRLRGEIERLESENAALLAANTRQRVADANESSDGEQTAEVEFEAIDAGGLGMALDGIDFTLIGETSHTMTALMAELAEGLLNGESVPLDIAGKLQSLNGNLVAEVGKMVEAGIAGSGVNGSYTHPAVAGNRILATLEAAGLGLDDQQRERLSTLMNDYGNVDRNLRIDEASREIGLETLVEEVTYKQKFFDEVRGMLGADQVAVLGDSAVGDRLSLSLHGPGLVLAQYAKASPITDRGSLVDQWSSGIESFLHLDDARTAELRDTVDTWANELPSNFFDDKADALELQGMMRTERVQAAARRQLDLVRRVLSQFGSTMTAAQREKLVKSMRIRVPLPR